METIEVDVKAVYEYIIELRYMLNLPEDSFDIPEEQVPLEELLEVTIFDLKEKLESIKDFYALLMNLP